MAVIVGILSGRAPVQQQLHRLKISGIRGDEERGKAALVLRGDRRPFFQQQAHDGGRAGRGRLHQGRGTVGVHGVHLRAFPQQRGHPGGITLADRADQLDGERVGGGDGSRSDTRRARPGARRLLRARRGKGNREP
jgi:hypothetical protein